MAKVARERAKAEKREAKAQKKEDRKRAKELGLEFGEEGFENGEGLLTEPLTEPLSEPLSEPSARKTPTPQAVACGTPLRFACRKTAVDAAPARAQATRNWPVVKSTDQTYSVHGLESRAGAA
jgi:hypothetical protein